jgi:hypothetical protein
LSLAAVVTLLGCSSSAAKAPPSFPGLDAAARAHLVALSEGWSAGSPALASSLSTGQVAIRDAAAAESLGAEEAAGDPTDFAFDIVSLFSHPLNGGGSDFIAYEKLRFHSSGTDSNMVELYHRDSPTAPWKAAYRAYFADNIDLPVLRLDRSGGGQLLTASELTAQKAQPTDLAGRYAEAVAVSGSGRAAFLPGQYTSGEVTDARNLISVYSDHGTVSRQWQPRPGGVAVALTAGVLVFANLQRVQVIEQYSIGTLHYFTVQDPRRVEFGGLLAPGHYSDLHATSSVTIAVVVTAGGTPDVVGRDSQVTSIDGQLAPV